MSDGRGDMYAAERDEVARRASSFLAQLLRALDHVHGAGVLHLDVKPENLMVTLTLQIKLTDWGLCSSRDPVGLDERGDGGAAARRLWRGEAKELRQRFGL